MNLEHHEAQTALWRKLKSHYEEKLDTLRARNDAELSLDETAKLRGQIHEIKLFLALDTPSPGSESGAEESPPDQW